MPGLQPTKLTVTKEEWKDAKEELLRGLNYLFKDIYDLLGQIKGVDNNVFSPTSLIISGLTASRLLQTNSDKELVSVDDLTDFIEGRTGEVTVTDNGDGTVTISLDHLESNRAFFYSMIW
jgi:hypothetical protein